MESSTFNVVEGKMGQGDNCCGFCWQGSPWTVSTPSVEVILPGRCCYGVAAFVECICQLRAWRPPERLITTSFRILRRVEEVFTELLSRRVTGGLLSRRSTSRADRSISFVARSISCVGQSVIRQDHMLVGEAFARCWGSPSWTSLTPRTNTSAHDEVGCRAEGRPWTSGGVPQSGVLDGLDFPEATSMKLDRRESFFCSSSERCWISSQRSAIFLFLQKHTVLTGNSRHGCFCFALKKTWNRCPMTKILSRLKDMVKSDQDLNSII